MVDNTTKANIISYKAFALAWSIGGQRRHEINRKSIQKSEKRSTYETENNTKSEKRKKEERTHTI